MGTALADPTRRRVLTMLLVGPAYPAALAAVLDGSRAKASNHLACLRGCGLVTATQEGRQVRYELADERLAGALGELARVVRDSPACPPTLCPAHDHHPLGPIGPSPAVRAAAVRRGRLLNRLTIGGNTIALAASMSVVAGGWMVGGRGPRFRRTRRWSATPSGWRQPRQP